MWFSSRYANRRLLAIIHLTKLIALICWQQCHVYQSDFELERKARQEMAGERDQMFADIKMLKKRNQALVDEAQS